MTEPTTFAQAQRLTGDVRDMMLAEIKRHTNWDGLNQAEQTALAESVLDKATDIVKNAITVISSEGIESVHGTLLTTAVKDKVKLVVEVPKTAEGADKFAMASGAGVHVSLIDPAKFGEEIDDVDISPDQPDLVEEAEATDGDSSDEPDTPDEEG